MRQQERERHVYDQRRWRDHEWGREEGGRSRRQAQRSVRRNTTSTEAQGAAPEKERRERRRVASAGEREAMRRLVGREYEMRAGERHRDCI
jgi:hypothetical protein